MNTNYIYVSNIPSNYKPVLLLHELENKWARMLYLENTFSGLRDAFIYNPTSIFTHFQRGVEKLREKIIEGVKPLTVFYVWFPPQNVFVSTMIPEGASTLPYIFMENLHKDITPPEIIYDLPLQSFDVKAWDIAERPDKCMVIKLPESSNTAMRSFVMGTLRSRMIRGVFPTASELIISEHYVLNTNMVPRSVQVNTSQESYLSNFFYMHEIPSKLTVKMLIEAAKLENIKGCRVFFVETSTNMKYGFMYLPKSLPHNRFMAFFEKLGSMDFKLSSGDSVRLKIQETWFKPPLAEPPIATEDGEEMLLTEYLHLSGIPANMQGGQLSLTCPFPLKLSTFPVNDLSTQIGFIVVRGLTEFDVTHVINHFRNLELGGTAITVDEVYIRCRRLPAICDRPFQLVPRKVRDKIPKPGDVSLPKKRLLPVNNNTVTNNNTSNNHQPSPMTITLSQMPPDEYSLMKTEFLCVDNLPRNVAKAALIFDIGRTSDGCAIIPLGTSSKAFVYYPGCDNDEWISIIGKFLKKQYGGQKTTVYEVYLQTGELTAASHNSNMTEQFEDSNIIFAYNISQDVAVQEIMDIDRSAILHVELLETTNGSKSAFILFDASQQHELVLLEMTRKTQVRGKPIYADIIKLASIGTGPTNKRIRMFNE